MKVVILDLEMNQPSDKIIQIGAVALHINSEATKPIGEFNSFVNPKETLTPEIVELTGISQDQVDSAEELQEVFTKFESWVSEQNPQLWVSWGGDWGWLYDQAGKAPPERLLDLKRVFLLLTSVNPSKKQPRGLLGALNHCGLKFQGRQHDALTDAKNTALLLIELIKRFTIFGQLKSLFMKSE